MELIRILLGNEEFICFYAPVSVWFVIEWMMSHAIGNFEEREAMLADDLKAVQRKIVKDSFADKMAALKKQEAEFPTWSVTYSRCALCMILYKKK